MGTRFSWDKEEPGSTATGSFRFSWEREADEKQADAQDMLLARPEVRNAAARMNTTPSAAPGLTAPKTDGLTTEIPLAKRSYQHANSILDTLRAPVTEQDVMARVKEMNAQAQKTLRDLDSQFKMNVDTGNLVYAKEIQQKRLDLIKQSKALTPAEAKRQLMSERSRDLVKAQPMDEDAWNTYAVNTLGWQDANRFQTDPAYRAMTKQAYQQTWKAEADQKRWEASRTVGNFVADAGVSLKQAVTEGPKIAAEYLAGLGANTQELLSNVTGLDLMFGLPTRAERQGNVQQIMAGMEEVKQKQTGGDPLRGAIYDIEGAVPDAILMMLLTVASGGGAGAASGAAAFEKVMSSATRSKAVMYGLSQMMKKTMIAAPEMIPMMVKIAATSEVSNKAAGMTDEQAFAAAVLNAYGQSLLEGGGINEAYKIGGLAKVGQFVKANVGEGFEEVYQNWWERSINAIVGGKPLPSFEEIAKEDVTALAGGLALGSVMGGTGKVLQAGAQIPGKVRDWTTPQVAERVVETPGMTTPGTETTRVLQTGADKANPDAVAAREREQRQADLDAAFNAAPKSEGGEYENGEALWQEAERLIAKRNAEKVRAAKAAKESAATKAKEAEVTSAKRLDVKEDRAPFTPAELKNAAVPMLDRLYENVKMDLEEFVNSAENMEDAIARRDWADNFTKEDVLSMLEAGQLPSGARELVEAKAASNRTAQAMRGDIAGLAQQVTEERAGPVRANGGVKATGARTVLPMPTPKTAPQMNQQTQTADDVTYTEKTPPVVTQPTQSVVRDVDTSKMLPGLRKKLEENYAKAKDRESEVMALARKGNDRTAISKALGMHPAEVRAVLQMNGVPDLHTRAGKMWVARENYKAYTEKAESAKAALEAGAGMEKVATEDGKIMKALNSIEEEQRVEAVRGLKRGITRVSDITSGHRYVQQVARLLGKHVVFYEGGDSNGFQTTAAPDTLFVRYSEKADTSLMFVTGHEFLHSLRTDNEALYNGLKSAFEASLTPKQIETILDRYKAEDQGYYERLKSNRDLLIEEIIADQAGNMFTDKAFWDKVYSYDTNLGNRLLQAAKRFLDKLLEYVGASKMDTDVLAEAQLKDLHDKFSKIVADRLGEGAVNPAVDQQLNAMGFQTNEDSVAPKYSQRTYRPDSVKALLEKKGFGSAEVERWIASLNNVTAQILNNPGLDYEASELYSALKTNGDPQYKFSLDFTTLCIKRYVMQATMEATQLRLGRGLNANEWLEIRKRLKSANDPVSCGLCYVESVRLYLMEKTNAYYQHITETKTWRWKTSIDNKVPFAEKLPPQSLFLSQSGLDKMKREYPDVYRDYIGYVTSATHSKPMESRTEYRGEILEHYKDPRTVAAQNMKAGQRIQSWSDFEAVHLLDLMQAVVDMAAVGLKAHAYTKVPNFVRAMGNTGVLINMSVIPKGTGLDKNGNLVFDDVEGMPIATAKALAKEFHKTAGIISIGVTNDQIRALLADPDIHYVIPYHISGMASDNLVIMGESAGLWTNYTDYQHENPIGKGAGKAPVFYEWWDNARTPAENIRVYKDMCAAAGVHPRFSGWARGKYNADFDFSNDPNYWKMLSDRRMFDGDGKPISHEVPRPEFNDAVLEQILNEYIENPTPSSANTTVVNSIVKDIEDGKTFRPSKKELAQMRAALEKVAAEEQAILDEAEEPEIVKFSTRRVEEIDKAFGEEGIRDANGKLLPLYHGTRAGSIFSAFERGTGFIDTYLGTHVAVDPEIANQFASDLRPRHGTAPRIYQVFAKGRVFDLPHLVGESDTVSFNRIAIEAAAAADNIELIQTAVSEQFDVSSATALKIAYAFAQGEDYSGKYELDEFLERMQDTDLTVEFGNILRKYLQDQGYGAVKYRNTNPNETRNAKDSTCYVILDPASIKSPYSEEAVDLENTDIRYSVRKAEIEEAFKDSKVRGADGELVEMYHGTNVRFNVFLPSPKREGNKSSLGRGFYFTSDKGLAEAFATGSRGRVMSVRLNIVDPLSVKTADPERLFPDDTRKREYLRSLKVDVAAGRTVEYNALREIIGEIGTNGIKAAGYDGVIHEGNSGFDEVVVFNSTQVRSVDGNNPVDLTNPDIRYSVRKTPSQYMATQAPSVRRSVFDGWTDFYSKMFNKAVRVEQVSKQAGLMANNALASGGVVRNIIERELVDRQGNRIGKSWAEVVKDVIEDGEFWDYMLTKHNISRQLEGKPVIDEDPQVSYLKAQQMEQVHPEWVAKAQEIYDWQDTFMRAWALDTGIIDPITYADWRMAYPHYLPTQREFSDLELGQHGAGPGRKYVNMPMPVKKATGSNRKIIPPVYSVAQMVNTMVRTAAYNDVGKALYDQVLSQPDPKVTILPMAAVIFRRNLDNVVTVWKDGLPHFMQIEDKPLLDALLNLPKRLMMPDFVNKISGGYRGLITHRNPIFAALNFARDAATAYVFGKEWNPLAFARDAAIAAGQIMQTGLYEVTGIGSSSAAYNRYRAVGGGGGGFLDVTDTKKLDAMLKPGARHKLNQIFDTLTSGLGEVTEQMWRLAAFNREMRKTGNVEQALADAMNITVNFARGGSWAKNIDPLMPYTNAYLQGVDTFVRRMFVEAGAPARWAKAVGIVTAPALIQLMMIAAAGEDEWDRYLSIKRETRDAYYHFPKGDGTYVRIPKSRELGVLFGAMAERIVTGDFEEMAKPWFQNFAPNNPFESNLLGGAWYLAKNETFSGATITPEYMKSLDADLQSDENTSSLMVALAKATGVGAKDLQFLFDHYTGIIGDILLPLTAQSGRNTALDVLRRVTTDRFTTDPAYSSQGISDFYDAKDAAEKAARTRNVRENLPSKMQTPEEYFAARLGDVSEAISKGNSYIRTLPASDPAVRQIRETTAKYATRAAKAQTAADLVSIAAQLNAELIRLGVR